MTRNDMAVRMWLSLLVLLLCIICDVRCASGQLREQAAESLAWNDKALAIADALPHGPDRDAIREALTRSSRAIKDQAKALDVAEEKANEAQADAKKWRWLKYTFFAAVFASVAFGGFRIFRVFRPA